MTGHYKRDDDGKQAFYLIKLNLHTPDMRTVGKEDLRELIAVALENSGGQEEIDFTLEIARYYDKNGD